MCWPTAGNTVRPRMTQEFLACGRASFFGTFSFESSPGNLFQRIKLNG